MIGILYFILSLMLCNAGDVIFKILSVSYHPFQMTFIRFVFSFISLLPFLLRSTYCKNLSIRLWPVHFMRASLLVIATICWIIGVKTTALTSITIITFTIPLFILPLSAIYLKETISKDRIIVTCLSFLGIYAALYENIQTFEFSCSWLILGALLFAFLDVVNKYYCAEETTFNMLFFNAFFGIIICAPLAYFTWEPLASFSDFALLAIEGVISNLILFALLKAFQRLDASYLAPFHYLEFAQSLLLDKLVFNHYPTPMALFGAVFIVMLSLYLTYQEFPIFSRWKAKKINVLNEVP